MKVPFTKAGKATFDVSVLGGSTGDFLASLSDSYINVPSTWNIRPPTMYVDVEAAFLSYL